MVCIAVQGVDSVDPRGFIGRIYAGTFLHTKYKSREPHGFREEDILSFPIIILLGLLIARV